MSRDSADIELISAILEMAALQVEPVQPTQERRCDLRAWDERERYLIEVKSFHRDQQMAPILQKGEIYEEHRSIFESCTISDAIKNAIEQLRNTDDKGHASLWLVALITGKGPSAHLRDSQILGTLHGTRSIVELKSSPENKARDCLYFAESAFFTYRRELDAALVVASHGILLALNDFSERKPRIRGSLLGQFFAQKGALNDAASLEAGGYLVADCDIRRKNQHQVLQYLARKYGLIRPIECTARQHSAWIAVERPR